MPKRALYDHEILQFAQSIPHFRGVFMRNTLPKAINRTECGVVNLDTSYGPGTHWVAYVKKGKDVEYFDSYGNLKPPKELVRYFRNSEIKYNQTDYQRTNPYNCGHLCLEFLSNKMI